MAWVKMWVMALGRILVVDDEAPVRAMGPTARTSTGERLETAALAAARGAAAGRGAVAGEDLAEIAMILDLAAECGDLPAADRALVESAIEAARRSLPVPR
jgi:hypothetical protein